MTTDDQHHFFSFGFSFVSLCGRHEYEETEAQDCQEDASNPAYARSSTSFFRPRFLIFWQAVVTAPVDQILAHDEPISLLTFAEIRELATVKIADHATTALESSRATVLDLTIARPVCETRLVRIVYCLWVILNASSDDFPADFVFLIGWFFFLFFYRRFNFNFFFLHLFESLLRFLGTFKLRFFRCFLLLFILSSGINSDSLLAIGNLTVSFVRFYSGQGQITSVATDDLESTRISTLPHDFRTEKVAWLHASFELGLL